MSPIRNQLLELATQMQSDPRITTRRKAGQQILEIVSDKRNRILLEKECSSSKDNNSSRYDLSTIWRNIISKSLSAATRILEGKSKPVLEDIMLPYRLLLASDTTESSSSSAFDHQSSHEDIMESYHHGTLENFDEYTTCSRTASKDILLGNNNKLSSKDIIQLLDYCISALSKIDENTIIENNLLEMFNYLLNKSDFVVCYRVNIEINKCLSEIEHRLSTENSIPVAKAFAGIINQCCIKLNIDIHIYINPCLNIVVNWINNASEQSTSSLLQILPQMYSVLINILSTYTNLCINAMEEYGKMFLSFAKKNFIKNSQNIVMKERLIEYFLGMCLFFVYFCIMFLHTFLLCLYRF